MHAICNRLQQVEKLIIVVGCQRSGTTLSAQTLGAPPNSLLLDESDGIYEWFRSYTAKEATSDRLLNSMLDRCRAKYAEVEQRIISHGGVRFSLAADVRYLVLKAPNLTYDFSVIATLSLPVVVVYPVRDPRSVVASMLELKHIDFVNNQLRLIARSSEVAKDFAREVALLADTKHPLCLRHAFIWLIKSRLYGRFVEHGIPTFTFRYEDLITHPRNTCLELTAALNIPFHEDMLAHQTVYVGQAQGRTDRTRGIEESSLSKWSATLSQAEEEQILSVAGTMMQKLGYT